MLLNALGQQHISQKISWENARHQPRVKRYLGGVTDEFAGTSAECLSAARAFFRDALSACFLSLATARSELAGGRLLLALGA
jgi:hypothetical protein